MERRGMYYPPVDRADPELQDLADGLRSALRDDYADASGAEMQDAVESVLEVFTPAEAFDFGSALSRISKGAGQVLSDPTFKAVAGTALPMAGSLVGTVYGGPAGGKIGGSLGSLAAGALTGGGRPAAPLPQAPRALPLGAPGAPAFPGAPATAPAVLAGPAAVAGGSDAATKALILTQQPDVLRSLLATALGAAGRKDVSGVANAQVLSQIGRLFEEAAADADDVQALLERVRPDPSGFAQRLLVQVMARFGDVPEPDPAIFFTEDDELDDRAGPTITVPVEPMSRPDPEVDTNMLLAAALGACQCWGLRAGCEVCAGNGCTGWVRPDRELFDELIRPAVALVSGDTADGQSAKDVDR
jgi:hypothetical protein